MSKNSMMILKAMNMEAVMIATTVIIAITVISLINNRMRKSKRKKMAIRMGMGMGMVMAIQNKKMRCKNRKICLKNNPSRLTVMR